MYRNDWYFDSLVYFNSRRRIHELQFLTGISQSKSQNIVSFPKIWSERLRFIVFIPASTPIGITSGAFSYYLWASIKDYLCISINFRELLIYYLTSEFDYSLIPELFIPIFDSSSGTFCFSWIGCLPYFFILFLIIHD